MIISKRQLNLCGILLCFATAFAVQARAVEQSSGPVRDQPRPRVEVVFCLDTTGSMGGLIAGAQQKIWSIVNGIVSGRPVPEVTVGLVAYRDRKDAYVTQVTDLTTDLDALHQKLFGLKAGGGGDGPESVNEALHAAVKKISWSKKTEKVYRVIFLVGDAPPHMDYKNETQYPELCKHAVLNNIVINTVRCGADAKTETIWKDIAAKSEGRYTSIAQSGGTRTIATPHDRELSVLSGKLVGTGVYFGGKEKRLRAVARQSGAVREAEEVAQSSRPAKIAAAADKSEYRAKTSVEATREESGMASMGLGAEMGDMDLVHAWDKSGAKALKDVNESAMPDAMKKLSPKARAEFLDDKVAERKVIQKKIDALGKKRAQYIQKKLKERGGDKSFDGEVMKMLKEQGAKRGIKYGK